MFCNVHCNWEIVVLVLIRELFSYLLEERRGEERRGEERREEKRRDREEKRRDRERGEVM